MNLNEITKLKKNIEDILNNNKAQNIRSIDLKNKTSIADFLIIASGTSSRHIQSLSELILKCLKKNGLDNSYIEGKDSNDWKLIDGIDIIIHIFHPEKRKFYDLEKMWSELIPKERLTI
jgi:ribosome-associated protein